MRVGFYWKTFVNDRHTWWPFKNWCECIRFHMRFYGIWHLQDFVKNMFFVRQTWWPTNNWCECTEPSCGHFRASSRRQRLAGQNHKCDDDIDRSQKVWTFKHSEHRPNQNDNERGQEVRISKHYDLHCECTQWKRGKQINATRGQHVRMCKSSELWWSSHAKHISLSGCMLAVFGTSLSSILATGNNTMKNSLVNEKV